MPTKTPSEKLKGLWAAYEKLAHAMQSGVAFFMPAAETEPKHLRVGVNSALVSNGALVQLLVDKGIFTEEEYMEKLNEFMQREIDCYKRKLADKYGYDDPNKVTLT